jgi:hypothetical protein
MAASVLSFIASIMLVYVGASFVKDGRFDRNDAMIFLGVIAAALAIPPSFLPSFTAWCIGGAILGMIIGGITRGGKSRYIALISTGLMVAFFLGVGFMMLRDVSSVSQIPELTSTLAETENTGPIVTQEDPPQPIPVPTLTSTPTDMPTPTFLLPTNTLIPLTNTLVPPTNTPVPPTNTPVPPTETLMPTPDTSRLFIDDFENGMSPEWITEVGEFRVLHGRLVVATRVGNTARISVGNADWSNYIVEFNAGEFKHDWGSSRDPGIKIYVRTQGIGNAMTFLMRNTSKSCGVLRDGQYTPIEERLNNGRMNSLNQVSEGEHHIQLKVEGARYLLLIDGRQFCDISDSTFSNGYLAIETLCLAPLSRPQNRENM